MAFPLPRVVEEEEPPTLPASSNEVRVVHQVEVVAMDVGHGNIGLGKIKIRR